jgi:hypothetical protein
MREDGSVTAEETLTLVLMDEQEQMLRVDVILIIVHDHRSLSFAARRNMTF